MHDLYIQVSGMVFTYDSSKPLGQKVISVLIGGQPIDPSSVYSVTTNSGVFGFLSYAGLEPANPQDTGLFEYEVVRDYAVENSPISYQVEGRIEDVFETPVEELHVVHVPQGFELLQNYPNPFNPATTIEFKVPVRAKVTITMYNMLGQLVKVLVDSELEAGYHMVTWDGSNVANGIYYYQLKADGVVTTKCMVLMK